METYFDNAKRLFDSKKYSAAIDVYKEIYYHNDSTREQKIRALNNLSLCCANTQNYSEALKWADMALSLDHNNVRSLIRAAIACEGENNYNNAISYVERAEKLEPSNVHVVELLEKYKTEVNKMESNTSSEQKQECCNNHDVIIDRQEIKKLEFYYTKSLEKGKTAMQSSNYSEAIRYYTKSIDLYEKICGESLEHSSDEFKHREKAILLCNRSAAYYHQGKYSLSLEDAIVASELNASYSRAFYRQACAYDKLCEFTNALNAIDKCLVINPSHKEANTLRAEIEPRCISERQSVAEKLEARSREIDEIKEAQRQQAVEEYAKNVVAPRSSAHATSYTYCNYCNERGHTRAECPLRRRKRVRSEHQHYEH